MHLLNSNSRCLEVTIPPAPEGTITFLAGLIKKPKHIFLRKQQKKRKKKKRKKQ